MRTQSRLGVVVKIVMRFVTNWTPRNDAPPAAALNSNKDGASSTDSVVVALEKLDHWHSLAENTTLDNGLRAVAGSAVMKRALAIQTLNTFCALCGGQKAASVKLGCSPQFVGQMLHGQRGIPERVLAKLGLKRAIVHAKLSA